MSIRDRQIQDATEEILKKELASGRYPDLAYVEAKVADYFRNRQAGLPRLKPKHVENKEVSNADDYNHMMESIHQDLSSAYSELMHQTDRMMAMANYYDTEKNRINLEMKKVGRRIEVLDEKLGNRGVRQVIYDTFNDFNAIEMDGDKARNVPVSNAFVDLRHGYVTLEEIAKSTDKINIATAQGQIKAVSKFTSTQALSKVENLFTDKINEGWRYKAILSEAGIGEVNLNIELPSAVRTNLISFTPQSPKMTYMTLSTSMDGQEFEAQVEREVEDFTEWHFEAKDIKYIQIKMKKTEADVVSGTNYEFYFGGASLSVRYVEFMESNVLTSSKHEVGRPYDKVTLKVDEYIPPDTNIEYFIGEDIDEEGYIVEWQSIEPDTTVVIDRFEEVESTLSSTDSNYGVLYLEAYGLSFYVGSHLQHNPANGLVSLHLGEEMYAMDTISHEAEAGFIAGLDLWRGRTDFENKYVAIASLSNGGMVDVAAKTSNRFTTYLYLSESIIVDSMSIITPNGTGAIYVNNVRIKEVGGVYTVNLRKGMNMIQVFTYHRDAGKVGINLDLSKLPIGTQVFAKEAEMEQVSLYDLFANTSKFDINKFALDPDNNIILNHDPYSITAIQGEDVYYRLRYKYPKNPENKEASIRFMSKLSRKDTKESLTPILKSYKLILE